MRAAVLLVALLSGVGIAACGRASDSGRSQSRSLAHVTSGGGFPPHAPAQTAPPGSYLKEDNDSDEDEHGGNPEGDAARLFSLFPHRASQAELRTAKALIERYYAAAAAGDGAAVCSLLSPDLVNGLAVSQPGSSASVAERCAASVSKLLAGQHAQLVADEAATIVVTSLHLGSRNLAVAALGFRRDSEGELLLERHGRAWKIDMLFAANMP